MAATANAISSMSEPIEAVNAKLPGLRKAAILVIALGDELAKALLLELGDIDVQKLTEEIAVVKEVPPATIIQVMYEFYALLETQEYMLHGGIGYATKVLVETFGKNRADELLTQVRRAREATQSDLAILRTMEPQQLSKLLEGEHPQTIALVLAHMDPKRAAIVLMNISDQQRVAAVQRLAEMRQFSPEMAQKVALSLFRRMEMLGSAARQSYSGFTAVADLLNRLDAKPAKEILEEIEKKDPKIAIGIRNLMFTFEDLLTVPVQSIRELVGAADKRQLAIALKGARDDMKAMVCMAMSSRAAEMLREDMDAMGPVRGRDVSRAQYELLELARKMESEGKIILKMENENDFAV